MCPYFVHPVYFVPKWSGNSIALSFDPIWPNQSHRTIFFLSRSKQMWSKNKNSTTSFSSFPFTVALGDPSVCVMLLPCIGWTVDHSHLVVAMLDVQRQVPTPVHVFTNNLFFIYLFTQVLHPSTDPGLLLWTLLFSLPPLNQVSSPLPTRDQQNLTNQRRRPPI